ncbi:MAG: DNA recombination protein RmuC [Oligoflexia bacterium]|nr:DNA recombination protein RmuC [Oligoflexia bacterium]
MADLEGSRREQQAQLKAEKEKVEELKTQFEKQKSELKNEFRVLSEEIIKDRQKILNEQNKENVGSLLKPLQEEIQGFRKRVNEVHTETVKGNTSLEGEIRKVMEMGLKMRDEATRLTSALKGDSQKRGAWGEAQLERTLQMSGLVQGEHYEKQSSFKDELGKQKRTDYLIKLPDNKHIIIDSKVSLISYEKAVSAETEPEQQLAMDEYVKSVKKHIDDLASKNYASLNGINSPSFVLMFMPIEPAYIEALKHDKSLFGYGYDKHIILLSHTTLIPILRTVANLWIMDKSYKEAGKISEKAGDIYNSVCSVFQRFEKLGHTLNTASGHYNDVVTALAGKQGLQGKVERFKQISKKASKEMPQLEPRHSQYETSKLKIYQDNSVKTET